MKVTRRIGRATLYKINMQHPLVKRLYDMVTQTSLKIAEEEMEKIRKPVAVKSR